MNLFYLRHHYLSVIRSRSFGGEVVAFLFLAFFGLSMLPQFYATLDSYAFDLAQSIDYHGNRYELFALNLVAFDLFLRLIFKRPRPKQMYYALWTNQTGSIAWQYMITSLFGILPFIFLLPELSVIVKVSEWLGPESALALSMMIFFNFYLGLFLQFSSKKIRITILLVLLLLLTFCLLQWLPLNRISGMVVTWEITAVLLAGALGLAFYAVENHLRKRVIETKTGFSLYQFLPVLNFRNPVFQLEWALIVRNRRTRSNLLLGMISIAILPMIIDEETPEMLSAMIFLIATSFFVIQHGVYSLGWEGNYFDFLITNIRIKEFIENRYRFYGWTCATGFMLCLIPVIINGLDLMLLIAMLLYNLGVMIPLVLYRSVFNSTRISLSENSFMNYNGMMTGPIILTSFLVIIIPMMIFGIVEGVSEKHTAWVLGTAGVVGILLKPLFTRRIIAMLSRKKYHLSQSFKS